MSLLVARDLACRRAARTVFSGLGFALGAGGALVLEGPNGSGKTSLLRCLAGLLRPAAGDIVWQGSAIARDPEAHRERVNYVGHQDAVKPLLTVAENLRFWAGFAGTGTDEAVAQALDRLAISSLASLPARLLSAGQRRCVALSRLLVRPAPLWLLDEPAAGLDDAAAERFLAAVAEHRASAGLVVVALHGDARLPQAERLPLARFAPDAAEIEPW